MSGKAQAVVVTGAGKGIGHACVLRLAKGGYRVYAGVRKLEDGQRLRAESGVDVIPVVLDVTQPQIIKDAASFIKSDIAGMSLLGLVNNAGIAIAGPLEFLPIEELRRQLEVNVIGQVAVTQAFLPMLRASHGRIVNIGSIAGKSAMPMTGPYAASKFALEAITDSLRVELMAAGVDVIIIEPGVIATPIWETSLAAADKIMSGLPREAFKFYGRIIEAAKERARGATERGQPADVVARVVEEALTSNRPKTRYVIGRDAHVRKLFQLLPDRWRDRLIARQLERM
jgi:NAD(P)-dependent dehydrogenase (short-subunit alcohol dehydrogenase family)